MGDCNRSTPSRKKERFSGTNSANRSLAEICATSDSTCEKSGLMVRSTAVSEVGVYLTSRPTCCCMGSLASGDPRPAVGRADELELTQGAPTKCPPVGNCCNPSSVLAWHTKQLNPRGTFADRNW